jgi:hypothetical protein
MNDKITPKTTIAELGAIVCEGLKAEGIDAFLSGGAVVSIYTDNKYESFDLDFVSIADRKKIKRVMESLGFNQDSGRMFVHPKSRFSVEFPGAAALVGDALITQFKSLKLSTGTLKLLTPTDCVKDRLAAFYHWNDRQGLDQAVWVALAHPVKLADVKSWSSNEGKAEAFTAFEAELKRAKKSQLKRPK